LAEDGIVAGAKMFEIEDMHYITVIYTHGTSGG